MKKILGIVLLVAISLYFLVKWNDSKHIPLVVDSSSVSKTSSSKPTSDKPLSESTTVAFLSSSARSELVGHSVSSASISSVKSLSGARVDPLPEIANFLRQLDNIIIPKVYLPTPKRDLGFDYFRKTKPSEWKEKALAGDPYAAYYYAEYLVRSGVRTVTDKGDYTYELDSKKRALAMSEAREFYIRGFRGGIVSIAGVLSKLYANPSNGGNRIESLAWRKISFAVGESERYECLRNSMLCTVKDFNNLNRLEYFYPCLSSSGDSCTQSEYDTAMMLALEYVDSLDFALNNKVGP